MLCFIHNTSFQHLTIVLELNVPASAGTPNLDLISQELLLVPHVTVVQRQGYMCEDRFPLSRRYSLGIKESNLQSRKRDDRK